MLSNEWTRKIGLLDHAYQPIVNIHSGLTYGFEALLRGWREAGFESIQDVYDSAEREGLLFDVETQLRIKSIDKFLDLPFAREVKLFCNIDNRILITEAGSKDVTAAYCASRGFSAGMICFEISERHAARSDIAINNLKSAREQHGFRLVVDDFGTGYAGLDMLFQTSPHAVKIDQFFIRSIASDPKRKLFLSHIVNLARSLGMAVIAEGVENEEDLRVCRDVGCDHAQGYHIARPVTDLSLLFSHYESVSDNVVRKRSSASIARYLDRMAVMLPTVQDDCDVYDVVKMLRENPDTPVVPVLDSGGEPIGTVSELDVRQHLYNPFGHALLANKGLKQSIRDIVRRCPAVDRHISIDVLVDVCASEAGRDGVLITDDHHYAGFLTTRALLELLSERNIARARDQNPLSGLPGNVSITAALQDVLEDTGNEALLIYADLDRFKAFNDFYGFRRGDRAILMCADMLRASFGGAGAFVGHLGGDDFCLFLKNISTGDVRRILDQVQQVFTPELANLYDLADRQQGFIRAYDREGQLGRFPLMRLSFGVLALPGGRQPLAEEDVIAAITRLKKLAKKEPTGIAWQDGLEASLEDLPAPPVMLVA